MSPSFPLSQRRKGDYLVVHHWAWRQGHAEPGGDQVD